MSDDVQKIIFSKNLNQLLINNEKTQREVADAINVSPQTFNTWCQGIALPRMGKVQLLADYFHINKSDLIEDKASSPKSLKIIDYYNQLNDLGKHEATKRVEELTYLPQYINDSNTFKVNAAHAISGASDEDIQHDEDIMNGDDF